MSPERKIRKAQIKQDKLVSSAFKASEYIQEHKKYFYIGLASVIAAALAFYLVNYSISKRNADAIELFGKGQLAAAFRQTDLAMSDYQSVVEQYGSSPVAGRACYLLAGIYRDKQNYDSALVYYELYIDKYGTDKMLLVASYASAAVCLEEMEDFSKAGEYYLMAAELADDDFQTPGYYMSAGRNFAKAGRPDDARSAYQQVVDNFRRSTYYSMARKKIAEVEYRN